MTTRLCLIRHGETDWNAEGRLQGAIDIPLNAVGVSQAQAAARSLREQGFDALYCSDLQRARMTAEIIGDSLHLQPRIDARWRERHLGLLQGLTREEASARFPDAYGTLKARRPDYLPPEGEAIDALVARVEAVLSHIAREHAGQSVVVVSHGGVLDIAYRLVMGIPYNLVRSWRLNNAALNCLQHDGQRWQLIAWDDVAHLQTTQPARDEQSV
jgi:2,3-bisphosphoglycerate-dependent phosphoglycerate mutase